MRRDVVAPAAEQRDGLEELHRATREQELAGASLSGNERNRLFLSAGARRFDDVSAISALDSPADGRAVATLDYDRDGWIDLALVNANAPMLQLFRNGIGRDSGGGGRMLALRFVGGNRSARPAPSASARDGYGAQVTVDLGDRKLLREHRCGEGLAAQNSATMLIGIGDREIARAVSVRWPSGRVQTAADVPAGTLLVVHEDPEQAPHGEAFSRQPYAKVDAATTTRDAPPARAARPYLLPPGADQTQPRPRLRLYTTMAGWCEACVREIPQFDLLRAAFAPEDLALYGIPVDTEEDPATLVAWSSAQHPPYRLLSDLPPTVIATVKRLVLDELGFDAIPATFVTDADGRLLLAQWGAPTVSRLRELLWANERAADATRRQNGGDDGDTTPTPRGKETDDGQVRGRVRGSGADEETGCL